MSARLPRPPRRRAAGFTLIEVLVAILLFSVGILGLVGMQARLLQATAQNGDRARASMLANELVSAMWAQQSVDVPAATLSAWQSRVGDPSTAGLPNGLGSVAYATASGIKTATITITWKAPAAPAAAASSSFTTSLVIP
jgi:type IV pilus assembly protein PilV